MREVYLDNYAAHPLPDEVREAMMPYLREFFGNPSSLHRWGDKAREAVEEAREKVASLINGDAEGVIFTSCGTEANNLAIKGIFQGQRKRGNHLVVSQVEHFSVLNPVRTLEKQGAEVTLVPVDGQGRVDLDALERSLRDNTVLVSIMAANGEVGTIQPLKEVASLVKGRGILLHSDAVAAASAVPLDVEELGLDAVTLSSDLLYGPKGAGALWVRKGVRLIPQLEGGVQEGGRRGGTENVPAIVGMGKAAELAKERMQERNAHLAGLRNKLVAGITGKVDHVELTGHPTERLPWNASFVVEFVEGEAMLLLLNHHGVAVSSGSACTSRALKSSHVLNAMKVPPEKAQGSILFSLGLHNTPQDVDYVIEVFPSIVERLRSMSPLYDKFLKEGGR
ncbi:MAG: cysteine desulfurase family protein [Candidatus Geothermincolales bacterium]